MTALSKHSKAAPAATVKQSAPDVDKSHGTTTPPRTISGFKIPKGARAMLVHETSNGEYKVQPVAHDASVLNIERDLLKHLNDAPRSTEWLQVLRAYCDQRLAVREKAGASGCVVSPSPAFDWDMTRLAALRTVQS